MEAQSGRMVGCRRWGSRRGPRTGYGRVNVSIDIARMIRIRKIR